MISVGQTRWLKLMTIHSGGVHLAVSNAMGFVQFWHQFTFPVFLNYLLFFCFRNLFDADKKRVIHYVKLLKHFWVWFYLLAQFFPILNWKIDLLPKVLVFEKVYVFKSCGRFCIFCAYFPCDTRPLQIINSKNIIFWFEF